MSQCRRLRIPHRMRSGDASSVATASPRMNELCWIPGGTGRADSCGRGGICWREILPGGSLDAVTDDRVVEGSFRFKWWTDGDGTGELIVGAKSKEGLAVGDRGRSIDGEFPSVVTMGFSVYAVDDRGQVGS